MSKEGGSKGPMMIALFGGGLSSSLSIIAIALVVFFLVSRNKKEDSIEEEPLSSSLPPSETAPPTTGEPEDEGSDPGNGSGGSGSFGASGRPTPAPAMQGSQIEIAGGFCAAPSDTGVRWIECDATDPVQRWEYRNSTGNMRSLGDADRRCLTHDAASDTAKLSACKSPASNDQRWGLAETSSSNLRPMSGTEKCMQAQNDDPAGNPDIRVTNCGVTENGGMGKTIRNIRNLLGPGTELRVYPPGQRPRTLSVGGKCINGDTDVVNSTGGGYCLPANTEWTYGADGTLRWKKGRCLSLDTSATHGAPTEGTRLAMKDCAPGNPEQRWREQDGKLKNVANTKYCATRTSQDEYVLSRCDAAGTNVAGVSSELFADIPRSSLDPAVRDANTDDKDDGLDYKRVRIRNVSHPSRCLHNVNGRVGLVPCDSAQWFRYDSGSKQLRLYEDGTNRFACLRHMGHERPMVVDVNCPVGDAATMFHYEKMRPDSETGRIRMSNVNNQCVDVPGGNANAQLQTFSCNNGNNQLFYSDSTPEGSDWKDLKGKFGRNFWGIT